MMISRKKFTFRYFLFFGLVPALLLFCSVLSANEVAVIKVQYRSAAELVPVVQSMLSAGGSVTVSQRVNSLVIVDNPEAIQRVHAFLEQFDKPVEQVRIHVRFNTADSEAPLRPEAGIQKTRSASPSVVKRKTVWIFRLKIVNIGEAALPVRSWSPCPGARLSFAPGKKFRIGKDRHFSGGMRRVVRRSHGKRLKAALRSRRSLSVTMCT